MIGDVRQGLGLRQAASTARAAHRPVQLDGAGLGALQEGLHELAAIESPALGQDEGPDGPEVGRPHPAHPVADTPHQGLVDAPAPPALQGVLHGPRERADRHEVGILTGRRQVVQRLLPVLHGHLGERAPHGTGEGVREVDLEVDDGDHPARGPLVEAGLEVRAPEDGPRDAPLLVEPGAVHPAGVHLAVAVGDGAGAVQRPHHLGEAVRIGLELHLQPRVVGEAVEGLGVAQQGPGGVSIALVAAQRDLHGASSGGRRG